MKTKTQKRIEELEKGCGSDLGSNLGYCGDNFNGEGGVLCGSCEAEIEATKQTLKEVGEVIDIFQGEEYTDKEIWEEIKPELKKELGIKDEK